MSQSIPILYIKPIQYNLQLYRVALELMTLIHLQLLLGLSGLNILIFPLIRLLFSRVKSNIKLLNIIYICNTFMLVLFTLRGVSLFSLLSPMLGTHYAFKKCIFIHSDLQKRNKSNLLKKFISINLTVLVG